MKSFLSGWRSVRDRSSDLSQSSADGLTLWRGDGRELFYFSADRKPMAVEVKGGAVFEPGIPKALFDLSAVRQATGAGYAVTADGQRFLFVSQTQETATLQYTVVVNWTAELKK